MRDCAVFPTRKGRRPIVDPNIISNCMRIPAGSASDTASTTTSTGVSGDAAQSKETAPLPQLTPEKLPDPANCSLRCRNESAYSGCAKVVTVIAADFNADPKDSERTFAILREKFTWASENVSPSERVTNPANGRYPDACFDGFLVRGAKILSCKPILISGLSDHLPAILAV